MNWDCYSVWRRKEFPGLVAEVHDLTFGRARINLMEADDTIFILDAW